MPRGSLMMLSLLATMWLWPAAPARATSIVDVRSGAVGEFWQCLRGKPCPAQTLFKSEAFARWPRIQKKMARVTVKQVYLVPQVPATFKARYQQRWGKAVAKLAVSGYDRQALLRLGNGKALVNATPRVALAFMAIDLVKKRTGRAKTEYLFVVLWRYGYRYHVAYWEDSPRSIVRFMTAHKP